MTDYQITRQSLEQTEQTLLASYATRNGDSRGRVHTESEHPYRTRFQRDRDRIIHSTAFRRLEYKTQVFVNHEGDHYRTRLTHTIEVSQIARSLARALRLNEDLAEAIALVHDVGHTPFGHAGEEVLNGLLKDHGGFSHNRQSLRVVDLLEEKYPEFCGLNLSYEVREGIVKHGKSYELPIPVEFHPEERATLESQLVNIADEIAYNCHDVDDGLYSGLLTVEGLRDVELFGHLEQEAQSDFPRAGYPAWQYMIVRRMINLQVSDVVQATLTNLGKEKIDSLAAVRQAKTDLIGFSAELQRLNDELRLYLFEHMYRHYRLIRMADKARRIITALFEVYQQDLNQIPPSFRRRFPDEKPYQIIADYIAGMTDRFAILEYKKLFDPLERV